MYPIASVFLERARCAVPQVARVIPRSPCALLTPRVTCMLTTYYPWEML